MTDLATRPGYDWLGIPLLTDIGPYCGSCGGRRSRARHIDVEAIRACATYTAEQEWAAEDAYRADLAVERYFEDRGHEEAEAQDAHEARHGVIGFIDAWHLASPGTCPCPDHEDDEPDTDCRCGQPDCGAC